ncbi:MAG: helix-turn-helix transcriptional regulator [Gammaproteobacteria bacterium]
MNKVRQERLERQGWKIGSTDEFLALTPAESRYLDLKLRLGRRLCERRKVKALTQFELARQLHSSQSRVVKMESGDPGVSLDLLVRSLFMLGVTRHELARILTTPKMG